MKAIRAHAFGGPEVLQLEDIDDHVPGAGEVVIDVGDRVFAGVAPGFSMQGCYAEKVLRPTDDVLTLPDQVGFAEGSLRPVIGRRIPLADAARALETVLEPGAFGKIVLVP